MSQTKLLLVLTLIFGSLLVIFFFISSFNFNPGSSNPIQKPVNIDFVGVNLPEEVMNEMLSEYKKIKPSVSIKYSKKSYQNLVEYRNFVTTSLKNNNSADIIEIGQGWVPFLTSEMNANNEFFVGDEYKNTFFNTFKSTCVNSEIKTICVPLFYDGLVLAYNKDMFTSAGLNPPVTWEDLRESAIKLTVRDSNNKTILVSGAALGTTNNVINASDIIMLMLLQGQVKIPNDLDTQASLVAFNYYTNFYKKDKVWSESMPDSIKSFAIQKTAMAFVKYSQLKEILDLNPTIPMGLIAPPQLPLKDGGLTSNFISSNWVEMISANSSKEEQKESWAFLKWLSSSDSQKKMSEIYSKYSRFGVLYSNKQLKNDASVDSVYEKPFLDIADKAGWSLFSSGTGTDDFVSIMIDLANQVKDDNGSDYKIYKNAEDKIKAALQKGL